MRAHKRKTNAAIITMNVCKLAHCMCVIKHVDTMRAWALNARTYIRSTRNEVMPPMKATTYGSFERHNRRYGINYARSSSAFY